MVSVGDSIVEVMIRCGRPTYTYVAGEKEVLMGEAGETSDERKDVLRAESEKKKVKIWYYNLGANDFIYGLVFEGGILTAIERGRRGK